MKPGDKLWVFSGEEIVSFVFDGYGINGDIYGHKDAHTRIIIIQTENLKIFPTREALCEHYRKIFE